MIFLYLNSTFRFLNIFSVLNLSDCFSATFSITFIRTPFFQFPRPYYLFFGLLVRNLFSIFSSIFSVHICFIFHHLFQNYFYSLSFLSHCNQNFLYSPILFFFDINIVLNIPSVPERWLFLTLKMVSKWSLA